MLDDKINKVCDVAELDGVVVVGLGMYGEFNSETNKCIPL
jgi:hypothetical protein